MGFSQKSSLESMLEPSLSTLTVPRGKLKGPRLMSHPMGICRPASSFKTGMAFVMVKGL